MFFSITAPKSMRYSHQVGYDTIKAKITLTDRVGTNKCREKLTNHHESLTTDDDMNHVTTTFVTPRVKTLCIPRRLRLSLSLIKAPGHAQTSLPPQDSEAVQASLYP